MRRYFDRLSTSPGAGFPRTLAVAGSAKEALGIIGRNGVGKSSLLKILSTRFAIRNVERAEARFAQLHALRKQGRAAVRE